MPPEMTAARLAELPREELITRLYEALNKIQELEERLRLKKNANDLEEFIPAAVAGY